ncbi:MAG: hypothetical protein O2887_10775 [Bacteroidetes bacterium]|nr:hypothetical protein [Bacteroidota bacterium]MDA1120954.1 hypothetical protein [Bacteroidota bacterium]
MKLLHRSTQLSLIIVVSFSSLAIAGKPKIEGTWNYEAQGTPIEYATGQIVITKKDKSYNATLYANFQTMTATNVEVDKSEVSFRVYIEDINVSITITVEGDSMTGKADTSEGSYLLSGNRKLAIPH